MKIEHPARIFSISLLFAILFFPSYTHLFGRFLAEDSYYSHGFLIPFICLYLVWRKRNILKSISPEPAFFGLPILLLGIILHLSGMALKINFASYFSMPIIIFGIVLYLGGRKLAKELIIPISFLVFMLPLPKVLIIGISFKLKIAAAQTAAFLVNCMGIEIKRAGSTIYYPGGSLLVGDPCSGLRSLISFLTLGAVFTQFFNGKFWQKSFLFLSAVPIAFFSNAVRIIFLILISYIYGEKTALGFWHDFSGIAVFVLGFLGLIGVSKVLKCHLTAKNT